MAPDTDIPELPANIQLEYLAEGGANIVYRILIPFASLEVQPSEIKYYGNATPPPTEIEESDLLADDVDADVDVGITSGKLLRLRKNVRFGLPYRSTADDFHSEIRPLFAPEELVDQFLVRVPPSLVQRCNEELRLSEMIPGKRPVVRHGIYLATDEPLGMLVTDMTNNDNDDFSKGAAAAPAAEAITVAELKPKWLVQSPSAPPGSKRCRTCALRDMKTADAAGVNTNTLGKAPFCPLDLISENEQDMQRTLTNIFAHRYPHRYLHNGPSPSQVRLVARALYQHPTLLKLLSLQRLHNDVGLHGPAFGSKEMSLSMTLRDCSIFLKIPNPETPTEIMDIRLGDLDLKSAANGKAEYWLSIENRLINEGWYMGQQPSQADTKGECVLSR